MAEALPTQHNADIRLGHTFALHVDPRRQETFSPPIPTIGDPSAQPYRSSRTRTTPNCKYCLGSVLNPVALHQTVIGLKPKNRWKWPADTPDIVIACFGGGSNFGGLAFPFMRHVLAGEEGKTSTRFIAAEPAGCPQTHPRPVQIRLRRRGRLHSPPPHVHPRTASPRKYPRRRPLRYHGRASSMSQLLQRQDDGAVDIDRLESFEAGRSSRAPKAIPAPESCRTIADNPRSPPLQRDRQTENDTIQPLRPRTRRHGTPTTNTSPATSELHPLRQRPRRQHLAEIAPSGPNKKQNFL